MDTLINALLWAIGITAYGAFILALARFMPTNRRHPSCRSSKR